MASILNVVIKQVKRGRSIQAEAQAKDGSWYCCEICADMQNDETNSRVHHALKGISVAPARIRRFNAK